ncbi:MAG: tautomerase family protein [Roseateles asaccharophilus]|jgi:hypothetical protein|uniref:Tautomerase-like protein n=1 Tax=Roseateles asaccharophilus TaxID=582607 RepID=A0A4R6NBZ3_9BURK|nr:tautomerase family protein [Roseateles asaccharophilus]MDN3543121.1 tautomerase family protein [Roseateles asaccharophilus]TDP13181.1 tautomerase-like protein [Roseateles asaccharophilus]
MPLVTLTVRQPKPASFKNTVLDAVHAALVAVGVPATDRFQRVLELPAEDLRVDPRYPDLQADRGPDFVLIEILWSVGRSAKVKQKLLQQLKTDLAQAGIDTEQLMLVFVETGWESWSFGGGRLLHV